MQEKIWLKRVLIPIWVIEIIWFIVIAVFAGIDLFVYEEYLDGEDAYVVEVLDIAAVVLLAAAVISIIFRITEIALFARHRLSPVVYLVLHCIPGAFWIFIFVADIVEAVQGYQSGITFVFSTVLFLTTLAAVIYGSIVVHRNRKGTQGRGYYAGVEAGTSTGYIAPSYEDQTQGRYEPYAHQGTAPTAQGLAPNPFRDQSREPSPAPSASRLSYTTAPPPSAAHPAYRKSGEAETYYNGEAAQQSYEMQGIAYKPT
ncbi:hypothetical protein BAUCODRAFT_328240 [Baudoinia panamericana UAMH 10762]|uniref:MARVEL domain-containing protein n=1 Tax=Baudoinia panamericana (strain UAMH 10762) TaxID=717646 RepID=M2LBY8_BAUPA|nr:uncharacterized protein BAUCODRAFT_328240 [Baudoinia panamericana UAMH 10762]EMC91422.1 hypothetical protein BAUCODRAFT_328240 [Baudoinia panamericana UAMH 10762]